MSKLTLAAAGAALIAAAPALSHETTQSQRVDDRASWFEVADRDDNERLSREEFMDFRYNTATQNSLAYHGNRSVLQPIVERSFGRIDRDRNGMISVTEFANAPNLPAAAPPEPVAASVPAGATTWVGWWEPAYITAPYYLTANKFDADEIEGKKVVNLKGERIGEIERIVRTRDDNRYYAMIDLNGSSFFSASRPVAGVPLDDVLLFKDGASIFLSTKGEEHLRNAPAEVIRNFEEVDTLSAI